MRVNIIRGWNEMSTYRKIRRIISISLIVFGLWALTPYLYNRTVNEAFPSAAPAAPAPAAPARMADQPAPAMVPAAPAGMATQAPPEALAAQPEAPASASGAAPAQAPAATAGSAGPLALLTGDLIAGSFPGDRAEGKATVYRLEDGKLILRLENFSSTNGPDLFVTFHTGANPEEDQGEHLQIAALKGNQGNQNYELPANIDLRSYKSVVIWCRAFNIVFGYATLQQAA